MDSNSPNECIRRAIWNSNDDQSSVNLHTDNVNMFTNVDVPFEVDIVMTSSGRFYGKKLTIRFNHNGYKNDGKGARNLINQEDARERNDCLLTGSIDRSNRRKHSVTGVATYYLPITHTKDFYIYMKENPTITWKNEDWLRRHGFKKRMAKLKQLPYVIRQAIGDGVASQEVWHIIYRTVKNTVIETMHLCVQRTRLSLCARFLQKISLLGPRLSPSERNGKFSISCQKISYCVALFCDLRNLIFSEEHGMLPSELFGDIGDETDVGDVIVKLWDVMNAIARTFLGSRKEMLERLPSLSRNLIAFQAMHTNLFGTKRMMPTTSALTSRDIFEILDLEAQGLSGRKKSQECAETDNTGIKAGGWSKGNAGGGFGGGRANAHEKGDTEFTEGDNMMANMLERTLLGRITQRMEADEDVEYNKASDQREEKRLKQLERFLARSSAPEPLAESSYWALMRHQPRIAEATETDVDGGVEPLPLPLPVLPPPLLPLPEETPEVTPEVPEHVVFFQAVESDNEDEDDVTEEEEESMTDRIIARRIARQEAAAATQAIDDANNANNPNNTNEDQQNVLTNEEEDDDDPNWGVKDTTAIINQHTCDGYASALLKGDKKKDSLLCSGLKCGSWSADKNSTSFAWCNNLIDIQDNDGITVGVEFRYGTRRMNVDVKCRKKVTEKQQKGACLRAVHRFHDINKIVLYITSDETVRLKFYLDAPPQNKIKSWNHTDSKQGKFEEITNFKWQDPIVIAGQATNATRPQVLTLVFNKEQKTKLVNIIKKLQEYWLIPIYKVTDLNDAPLEPHNWNETAARDRCVLCSPKFPAASDDPTIRATSIRRANDIYEWSEFGTKANDDPTDIFGKICWQCGKKVFIPPVSAQCPFPAPSIKKEGIVGDGELPFKHHHKCVHADIEHQDSPCQFARDNGVPDIWPARPAPPTAEAMDQAIAMDEDQ